MYPSVLIDLLESKTGTEISEAIKSVADKMQLNGTQIIYEQHPNCFWIVHDVLEPARTFRLFCDGSRDIYMDGLYTTVTIDGGTFMPEDRKFDYSPSEHKHFLNEFAVLFCREIGEKEAKLAS